MRWPQAPDLAVVKFYMSDSSSKIADCHALARLKMCFPGQPVSASSRSSEKAFSMQSML